jgi:hypothetical protein
MEKQIPVGPKGQEDSTGVERTLVAVSNFALDPETGKATGGSLLMANGVTVPLAPDTAQQVREALLPPPPKPEKPEDEEKSKKQRQHDIIADAAARNIEDLPGQKAAREEDEARIAFERVEQGKNAEQGRKDEERALDKGAKAAEKAKHDQKPKAKH